MSPSPNLAALNAGVPGRPPEGAAMLAAFGRKHIAMAGRLGSGPALGPHLVQPHNSIRIAAHVNERFT
jgi:hypothetical protein